MIGRAKILDFFRHAADLLDFDTDLVARIITDPWVREVEALNEQSCFIGESMQLPAGMYIDEMQDSFMIIQEESINGNDINQTSQSPIRRSILR